MAKNTYYQDEIVKEKFNVRQLVKVLKYALPFKYYFLTALFLMLLAVGISLIPPVLLEFIVDNIVPARDYAGYYTVVVGFVLIGVSDTLITFIHQRMMGKTGHRIIAKLRQDVFDHIQTLPFDFFDSRPTGKIVVRVTSYLDEVANFFANTLLNFFVCIIRIVVVLAFMLGVNVRLSLYVLAALVPVFICVTLIKQVLKRIFRVIRAKDSNRTSFIVESIMGVKEIKSFNRSAYNIDEYKKVYGETLRKWGHFVLVNELNGPVYSILWNAGAMLLYIVSFGMVATGDLTTGTMIAFLNYMAMINDPFNQLTNILQQFANVSSNLERVFETLETESAVKEKPDAIVLTDAKGKIDFDDVTFRYEDGYNILEHFNLHVKPGESIALVGPTGCGKTTIINMLTRFYDVAEGSVKVDGVDVKDYTIKSLRQNVGVIMQDPFIFKGTVLDNIRYGRPDATDDECIEAAKEILADSFIERLPRAYNTQLAERGEGLSSGEKQMIGFARMVLKNPRVFIFDEATSSIDSETEEMIQNSLERIIQGRTSFMVAHRLSTIKKCDRILVIGNKGIAEQGTHEELLRLKGKYFELCKEQ